MTYASAKDIIKWVDSQSVDVSSMSSITSFVENLKKEIGRLNFDLPEGCTALGYAGSVDSNIKHNL